MLQLPIFDCDVRANQVVKTLKLTDSPSRARASIPHESLLATQGMADFALFYEMLADLLKMSHSMLDRIMDIYRLNYDFYKISFSKFYSAIQKRELNYKFTCRKKENYIQSTQTGQFDAAFGWNS